MYGNKVTYARWLLIIGTCRLHMEVQPNINGEQDLEGLPLLNHTLKMCYFSCSYLIRPCNAHEEQNSTDPEIMVPKSDSEDLHQTSL